ncbi:MAG: hypothetical protein V1799_07800 [bacterium]
MQIEDVLRKKPRKKLSDSPNLKEIDALLLSGLPPSVVKVKASERFGERFSVRTFATRKAKLRELVNTTKLANPNNAEAVKKLKETLNYQLTTIGEELQKTMKLTLDKSDPAYGALLGVQQQIQSFLRRSSEFFEDVDHLGHLRYALNVMHTRVAMLFKLEAQTGMPMRDNTENLVRWVDMIDKSIEIHQSLGLKPRFGDPTINMQVNVGDGGQVNISQSERNERFVRIQTQLEGLEGEKREKKFREILYKEIGLTPAVMVETEGNNSGGKKNDSG